MDNDDIIFDQLYQFNKRNKDQMCQTIQPNSIFDNEYLQKINPSKNYNSKHGILHALEANLLIDKISHQKHKVNFEQHSIYKVLPYQYSSRNVKRYKSITMAIKPNLVSSSVLLPDVNHKENIENDITKKLETIQPKAFKKKMIKIHDYATKNRKIDSYTNIDLGTSTKTLQNKLKCYLVQSFIKPVKEKIYQKHYHQNNLPNPLQIVTTLSSNRINNQSMLNGNNKSTCASFKFILKNP